MSAEVSVINGVAEMFSGNGRLPWWQGTLEGNANVVQGTLSREQAIEAAHLGWTVKAKRLQCDGVDLPFPTDGDSKEGWQAIARSDNGRVLGVVKGRYVPIQNSECFDFLEALTRHGGKDQIRYETAGALRDGKVIWLLAKYDGEINICGDKHDQYLLLVSSHDGSYSLSTLWTTVRVVCMNTLTLALRKSLNTCKIRHTEGWASKADEAKRVLGLTSNYFDEMRSQLSALNTQPMSQEDAQAFTRLLMPAKDENEVPTRTQNSRDHILDLYCRGAGNRGESRWDMLQGVSDYADHQMGLRGENSTRLESALLGSGAALKQRAFELLTAEDLTAQLIASRPHQPASGSVVNGSDFSRLISN